ncbi:MAG TPA: endonuclease/exonuclease/phosphatase family protein [Rubrobacteraceae bacterium]|nr:endonuclease/exonuclease/phosphatase family protein [Rubrobacteraceae bacterium]
MPRLAFATYNAYQEKNGRDYLLEELLGGRDALVFLQEVSPRRAFRLRRAFRDQVFLSPARHGLQYLATVLPERAHFTGRRTVQLNGYAGMIPAAWAVRRGCALYRSGGRRWRDCFEPRVAQVGRVSWQGLNFQVGNTHLPLESGLRNRSLSRLASHLEDGDVVLAGDLNATRGDLFLNDFILMERLRAAGSEEATHIGGRRIDYVLYRGGFREVGYSTEKSLSDHFLLRVDLEV